MRVILGSLIAVCVAVSPGAQRSGAPSTAAPTIPVIGHWITAIEAGAVVVTADATKWDGAPPADPDGLARTLFGTATADPAFRTNVLASGAFPQAVLTEIPTFSEGTLRIDFKLIGGASDQTAGLVFDLRPTGDYLYVRYNTRDDNVALWRFTKGQREVIAHGAAHRRLAMNAWHPLVLTVRGTKVTATAAGDLRVEDTLDRPVAGRVGMYTKRDSISAFRHWRLDPRQP